MEMNSIVYRNTFSLHYKIGDKMKVNTINLKVEIEKLNNLIDDYENIYLNLYNELLSTQTYWIDSESRMFNENLEIEKTQVRNTINELTNVKQIYEELMSRYEEIGNKLEFNPKLKNVIISKIDNCIDKSRKILELYNKLNLNDDSKETLSIKQHISILENIILNTTTLRNQIKEKYELIEEIEKEINFKISKINLEYIQEIGIDKYNEK